MSATKGGIKSPCTRRLCAARYEQRVPPVAQASILRFLHIVPAKDDRAGSHALRLSEVAHLKPQRPATLLVTKMSSPGPSISRDGIP